MPQGVVARALQAQGDFSKVLRVLGQESKQRGTDKLSTAQIDRIIKAARRSKRR